MKEKVVAFARGERETTSIGKQQFAAATIYTMTMIVGMIGNLLGLLGPSDKSMLVTNSFYVLLAIGTYTAYIYRVINVNVAFSVILLLTQVFTSIEMILCACNVTYYNQMLIIADVVLLAINILFSLIAYLKYVVWLLALTSIAVYWVCTYVMDDSAMYNFGILFTLIFVNVSILNVRIVSNLKLIRAENDDLKREEKEILCVLRCNRSGVKAYVDLAKRQHTYEETGQSLDILDPVARQNLIDNVKAYLARKEMQEVNLALCFPELSPSELEISNLILQGKKMSEICIALNKKESNITAQRTNIRRKLGLKSTDELRGVLLQRVASER